MITPVNNHVQLALARLREQYKESPNLAALITAFVQQIQDIEDAAQDLYAARSLDTATGIQLDLLGTLIGLGRNAGEADEPYRLRLRARVIQNISQGEPELVIQVMKILTSSTLVVFHENYPAAVELAGDGQFGDQTNINSLYQQINLVLPAGVRLEQLASFAEDDAFSIADANDDGLGFGDDLDSSAGGELAELLFDQNVIFTLDGSDTTGGGLGDNADTHVGGIFL